MRKLIAITDVELLKKSYTEVYLPKLELRKENKSDTETTFFDLATKIV